MKKFIWAVLALVGSACAQQQAAWVPPVGIPMPEFGVLETAGPPTVWVDAARGSDENPGTEARPRYSIPNPLAACTVVRLVGRYDVDHDSPRTIHANGTKRCPAWITGGEVTATWEVAGSYLGVSGAKISSLINVISRRDGGQPNTNHIVFRDNEFTGAWAGLGQQPRSATGTVEQVVFFRNNMHDIGDLNTTTDQDTLGIGLYSNNEEFGEMHHIWALENRWVRVGSDGMQVNSHGGNPKLIHHVYIGRNTCIHNRQGCAWAKQSTDVTMSENTCRDMRPDKSSNPGQCFGGQYNFQRLVIIKNQITNSENGVVTGSDDGDAGGILVAGNLITNVHCTTGSCDNSANVWESGAAMRIIGGKEVSIYNNTIDNVDGGIQLDQGLNPYLQNNIITRARRAYMAYSTNHYPPDILYGLFDVVPRFNIDGVESFISAEVLAVGRNIIDDPAYVNRRGGDYTLQPTSPAVGTGSLLFTSLIVTGYEAIHGVPIGVTLTDPPNRGADLKFGAQSAPAPPEPPCPCVP